MARKKTAVRRGLEKTAREREADLKRKAREKIRELKQKIQGEKNRAKAQQHEARKRCRAERKALGERIKQERMAERERLNATFDRLRSEAREHCNARKRKIRTLALSRQAKAKRILAEERRYQKAIQDASRAKTKLKRPAVTRREAAQESDDAVRSNLPPDLVPVFNRVKRDIKATPRMTRTEAFYRWAEENPGVVVEMQAERGEAEAAALIAEYEKEIREAERAMKRPRSRARRKLEAELAAVPF